MTVETPFKEAPPAFRGWRQEKDGIWRSTAPCGAEARILLSGISRKWVLTVDSCSGTRLSRRVASADEGRALAETWLVDLREALGEPAPVATKRRRAK
ncbi:hypothetical protein [Aquabacter cavernae]|uniref:hypothetical protein n=1 Tax=Aquabacter cavernae TaxID=2496029 RepID=UPI000F8D4C0D|nr:hypothetical protein [Aquabacter cavernae]